MVVDKAVSGDCSAAAGGRQPWSCLNPSLNPKTTLIISPSLTFQLVVQISATDKDVVPVNPKFKFALKNEDSNFTLINNHGKSQRRRLALRRAGVSVKSLKALRSSTNPTWGDRSSEGLSSYGVFCTILTI
jgi:hypothetical protein